MGRESHSHKAYKDFIRKIGAPVTLLTDNAKTLIGKKWTKTSRNNITKQRQIAPHNQQQNQSEGRLGKVKTMYLTGYVKIECAPHLLVLLPPIRGRIHEPFISQITRL